MTDNDLIRRKDALNAVQLGDTVMKMQARIAALPAVTDLDKAHRTIAARDRRIAQDAVDRQEPRRKTNGPAPSCAPINR